MALLPKNSFSRGKLLSSTFLVSAAAISASAGGAVAQARPPAVDAPIAQVAQNGAPPAATGPDPSVIANPASADGGHPPAVQEVVVTGSRIPQPNLTSTSPLTVVSSEEIRLEGTTNVENLLNNLPQTVVDQQSNVSNGATGTATVNLRDLGPQRTLVLVDGKRLMPGDPVSPYADLNNIPAALVSRVDVITGGASAVYGSDAVAGVVNFVMKHNFQGFQLDAQYDASQADNNNSTLRGLQGVQGISNFPRAPENHFQALDYDVTAMFGVNSPDDKGNVTAYAEYRNLRPILQAGYDTSACSIAAANVRNADSYIYDGHRCSGSNANSAYGEFTPVNAPPGALTGNFHTNPDGSKSFVTTSVPPYNYGPTNYFQREENRYTAGYFAHYRVNNHLDIYSDFMFADDQTVSQSAPSGLFYGTGYQGGSTFSINCNNPLLSASQATALCGVQAGTPTTVPLQIGFRFTGRPRDTYLSHTDYKINIGAKGEIATGWTYDVYMQYGQSNFSSLYIGDTSANRIQNALLVNPDGTCMTDAAHCAPLNIFQYGGLSPAAVNYTGAQAFQSGGNTEQVASGSITGDLGKWGVTSPFATSGVGVAFGIEYRREALTFNVDQEYSTGDLSGAGGVTLPNAGSFDVYELFGEVRVPLIENKPFAKSLTLDGGYRFSDYSLAGQASTYKVQLEWSPSSDVRFRGGYNRAVRAPNVNELFAPSAVQLFGSNDPCTGSNPVLSQAACVAQGFPAAKYGLSSDQGGVANCPSGQCSALVGGSKALAPETSDTFTGGVVVTPTFLRGLSFSIDYFNIRVGGLISSQPSNVLTACENGNATACASFHRDPQTGILFGNNGYVIAPVANSGFLRTDGIDLEGNYRRRFTDFGLPDWGGLSLDFNGTYTHELVQQPVTGGGAYNCAGLYGVTCGNPLPHWRHKVRLTYTPSAYPVTLSVQWRYVGDVRLDADQGNPLLANHPSGITDTADAKLSAVNYMDLTILWRVRDHVNFRVGCSNILNQNPPFVDANILPASGGTGLYGTAGNGNTFPGTYDALGRNIFVGLTADF